MKMRKALSLASFLLLGIAVPYGIHTHVSSGKATPMSEQVSNEKPQIVTLYDDVESYKIPAVVPLNDEQRLYLQEILAAMMRVMEQSSSLETEEQKILGIGKFRWPKNPSEPIKTLKSFRGENFRMKGISATFMRESEMTPWRKAGLTVHPRNFPAGVYSMNLPRTIFADFRLKSVEQEHREEERIKDPLVFYFVHKKIENFSLRIEARADVAKTEEHFPSSFHAIVMLRGSQ